MENRCLNCGKSFDGQFCPDCGQRAGTDRLTASYMMRRMEEDILQFDRGMLPTVVDLTLHTKNTVRRYLKGKRINQTNPFRYAFYINALYLLVENLVVEAPEHFAELKDSQIAKGFSYQVGYAYGELTSDNGTWYILLIIPFLALAGRVLFSDLGWNFMEHLSAQAYIMGHACLFALVPLVLYPHFYTVLINPFFYLFVLLLTGLVYQEKGRQLEFWILAFFNVVAGGIMFWLVNIGAISAFIALFNNPG